MKLYSNTIFPKFSLFSLLLCAFLCVSMGRCPKKEDDLVSQNCVDSCLVIKGTFTTADGTEAITNIPIDVYWEGYNIGGYDVSRKKAKVTTNLQGEYLVNFSQRVDEIKAGYYRMSFELDTTKYMRMGLSKTHEIYIDNLEKTKPKIANYLAPQIGYFNLSMTNFNEFINAKGIINIRNIYSWGLNGTQNSGGWHSIAGSQAGIKQPFRIQIPAKQKVIVEITRRKSSGDVVTKDSFSIKSNDVKNLLITY